MSKLRISDSLSLPIDAVTQKFAFLGRTGSGKSYGSTKLCELMLDAKAQVVALDPVGVWWGLRVDADGKSPGYSIPVFGGLHGDIPLEPGGGALIADLIVDRNISAVIDVSQFLSGEQARFACDFATQFFFRKKTKRSAVHLFVEECQEFVPQNPTGGTSGFEAKMLNAFERLIKLGRNFGIGASLISQRPQEVNKKVLNQTECVFAFQMTGPQERKAIKLWVEEKGADKDIVDELPKLQVGYCHAWSPQWLKISETILIAEKKTADVSSTPKPGAKLIEPKQLSQIELENLSEKMLATIERAKAEDPKELRKQIAELKRELAKANQESTKAGNSDEIADLKFRLDHVTNIKTKELRLLVGRLEKFPDRMQSFFGGLCGQVNSLEGLKNNMAKLVDSVIEAVGKVRDGGPPSPERATRALPISRPQEALAAKPAIARNSGPAFRPVRAVLTPVDGNVDFRLSAKQQQILDAIAWFESIGNPQPSTLQVGAVAIIDASGGHFSNLVGPLSSNGLVVRSTGQIALTDKGRQFASIPERVGTLADYHNVLRSRVRKSKSAGGKTIEILDVIINRGGADITTEEIGREANMDHTGGHFSNMIGPLSTIGLIRRSRGVISPTDILFPPGLP